MCRVCHLSASILCRVMIINNAWRANRQGLPGVPAGDAAAGVRQGRALRVPRARAGGQQQQQCSCEGAGYRMRAGSISENTFYWVFHQGPSYL